MGAQEKRAKSRVGPSWEEGERQRAVAVHGDFLVLRSADSCYAKQAYAEDPSYMELTVRHGEAPVLIGSWREGFEGPLTYRVDRGEVRTAWVRTISDFVLDPAVVPEMRAGNTLHIAVVPQGAPEWRQKLSLRGFTAATRALAACPAASELPATATPSP